MKVLSNCTVTKLTEYAQSYGVKETITVPFIKEFDKEIWLCNSCGEWTRTMKIGTKLLIDFTGTEITERQLKIRANKNLIIRSNERLAHIEKVKAAEADFKIKSDAQLILWDNFIQNNPASKAKYIDKVNTMPSSKWRNYLRLKACKHINNESFQGLCLAPADLKNSLFKTFLNVKNHSII